MVAAKGLRLHYHAVQRQQRGFGHEGWTALSSPLAPAAGVAVGVHEAVVARGPADGTTESRHVLEGVRRAPAVELELSHHPVGIKGAVGHETRHLVLCARRASESKK